MYVASRAEKIEGKDVSFFELTIMMETWVEIEVSCDSQKSH